MEKINGYAFVSHATENNKIELNSSDYERISEGSSYDVQTASYKLMGFKYEFRPMLKKYWYMNHGSIQQAYAKNIKDLKRVLRAHYQTISTDFKAVEIK